MHRPSPGHRRRIPGLLAAVGLACQDAPPPPAPPEPEAPPPASDAAWTVEALPPPAPGWGAVFWREEQPWQAGGGTRLVGPRATADARPTADSGPCGTRVEGAPADAVIAPPGGSSPDTPTAPPAVDAALVERAAWRLDESLPPADRFTPLLSQADPASQRGVSVGSVVKIRRRGAPPVLVVGGSRDCTGILAVLDASAASVLASRRVAGLCGTPRVLPPADLDGDGHRETVLFDGSATALFRLMETPARVDLDLLGGWQCPAGADAASP